MQWIYNKYGLSFTAVTDPSEATPETETDKTDKESLSPGMKVGPS